MDATVDTRPHEPSSRPSPETTPGIPGTTVPANSEQPVSISQDADLQPHSFPGPTIDGKATKATRYEPQQLIDSPLLQPIFTLTNDAYSQSHAKSHTLPSETKRLDDPDQFLRGLGFDAGTFCYVLCWSDDPEQPIATIGAHKYSSPVFEADAGLGSGKKGTTFVRVQLPDQIGPGAEIWELKSLAVGVGLQGKGVASWLMRAVEEEIVRRFEGNDGELWMVLTTMKEVNFAFYERRRYVMDYENAYEKGYLGSEMGFTVVHMSKRLV